MKPAFDDNIPKQGPEIFIKRLKGGEQFHITIYGSKIRGMWVHYNAASNRSEAHYEEGCQACTKGIPKRWKGFLHGYISQSKQEVFLELTPSSASAVMAQLDFASQLRGTVLHVKRSPAANGRIAVQVHSRVPDEKILLREKDPRRSIMKLWGIPEETIDSVLGAPEETIDFNLPEEPE